MVVDIDATLIYALRTRSTPHRCTSGGSGSRGRASAPLADALGSWPGALAGWDVLVPVLLGENRDRRVGLGLTMTLTAAGFLGLALAPDTATWVWIAALGVGHGGLFTLVLTLPVVTSRDPREAGRISAMAFFVGYASAVLAPCWSARYATTGDFRLAFGFSAHSAC